MLCSKLYRYSAIVTLTALCLSVASQADAAKNRPERARLGGVLIQNPTENPLSFQMRLGYEDAWTDYDVAPGQELQIVFELDRDGLVPAPNIRFDRIAGDNGLTLQDYELEFYEVQHQNDMTGFRYEFQYGPSGKTLDLYSVDVAY